MTQDQWTKVWKAVASIAVALSVIATALAGINISTNQQQAIEINQLQGQAAAGDVQARSANTPIYFDQGGKQLTVGSGATLTVASGGALSVAGTTTLNGGAAITGTLTVSGLKQYPWSFWGMDGVNGAMAAHGLPGAPTYPTCMLYTPIFPVTVTVYISAANATSVTLAMVDFAGNPYTGTALAVRCSAVYVP